MTARRSRTRRNERRSERRRLGIALGAGGARGLAHIGVLKALTRADVPIDAIAGSSSGALIGAIYAAGQLEDFEQQVRGYEWTDVLAMFDPVWPRSGLISTNKALERMAGSLREWKIEDLAIPFAAVAVDLENGEEVHITRGSVIEAVRASITVPGIIVPKRQGRRLLVDGAIRNPVPVSALEEMGVDVRVAVNLHHQPVRELIQTARAARTPAPSRPRVSTRVGQAIESSLARFRPKRNGGTDESVPNLFEILTASMTVIEHELARHRLAIDPVDVILEPELKGIRVFEFHKARRAIRAGEHAGEHAVAEIQRHLRKRRSPLRRR